jgi:hypothetical protein
MEVYKILVDKYLSTILHDPKLVQAWWYSKNPLFGHLRPADLPVQYVYNYFKEQINKNGYSK